MSTPVFCCGAIVPYRPQYLMHEDKFSTFLRWATFPKESTLENTTGLNTSSAGFAIQLVRQVNFGSLESKRYFIPRQGIENAFAEVGEDELIQANFQKLNTYKNFKCQAHNKFFELNIYQKDPVNRHHWRANLARPAREIDLQPGGAGPAEERPSMAGMSRSTASASSEGGAATKSVMEAEKVHEVVRTAWQREPFLRSYSPMKDFTACGQECGYCGECDY